MTEVTTAAALDVTAPTIGDVAVSGTTDTGTTLEFTPDEAGTYFYLVYAAADDAPTATEVINQGDALVKGTAAATATEMTVAITGLTAETDYKIYLVVRDAGDNESTVSMTEVTTAAAV